ncbi:MAG: RDD family protein [Dermatophilaceae bacterium]
MTQPSGWYDDPQDPSQLRYWDGVVWSSHVTPKVSPTVEQSTIGMPYGVAPAAARPPASGSHGAQGPPIAPGGYGPAQQWHQGEGQQGGPMPAYGQQLGWQSNRPTTPDGVELSGWWKRVLARIIDNIIISIVALPLTFAPMKRAAASFQDYIQQVVAAVQAGSSTMPAQPDAQFTGPILQVSLTMLVLYLVYEIALLTMTGATLGRRAVGISVRLRDTPGPPPLTAVLKRTAVKQGGDIVGLVPVLRLFGSTFSLIDVLWPLWDDKKQAIHDKVGLTNVVVGPQPKRDA